MLRKIPLLVPLAWLCGLCAPLAGWPSPAQRVVNLRSVTYYKFGTRLQDLSIAQLARDVAHAREIGFNGMWLVVTWRSLSPVALPKPELNEAAWQNLDEIVEMLSNEGLSIIWMWQDFKGSTPQQRSFGLLRLDGSDKPAVNALRKAFAAGGIR